jgi:hypothetical protein
MGTPLRPIDQPAIEQTLATARTILGSDGFAAAWERGEKRPLQQIFSEPPFADLLTLSSEVLLSEGSGKLSHAQSPDPNKTRVDWGQALAVPTFYGREWESALLTEWIHDERCRVITVLGMGGIGKSALTVTMMHQLGEQFKVVIGARCAIFLLAKRC